MNEVLFVLTWALPISFVFHLIEEFVFPGGFIKWYHHYRPQFEADTPFHYFKVNAIGFLAILATAISTSMGKGYMGLLIVWGFLSCNALFTHVSGAIRTKEYSPGMITGIVLDLPFTVLSYITIIAAKKLDIFSIAICIILSPLIEIIFLKKPEHCLNKNETNSK